MSGEAQVVHDHAQGDVPHGTRRGYITGFLLSVVLTAIPFALVMTGVIADARWTVGLVMAAALVQIIVHMVYFLHMDGKAEGGWTLLALMFTVVIVGIVIAGSLWVMYHMNQNMMPPMPAEAMHSGMDMGGM